MLAWWRRWRARRTLEDLPAPDDALEPTDDAPEPAHDALEPTDDAPEPAEPALTDELDLHTFQPRECADVVDEYLRAAQEAGLRTVRIVHGKGTGTLRRTVHGVLEKHPAVRSFALAGATRGSWGATVVDLHEALSKPDPNR